MFPLGHHSWCLIHFYVDDSQIDLSNKEFIKQLSVRWKWMSNNFLPLNWDKYRNLQTTSKDLHGLAPSYISDLFGPYVPSYKGLLSISGARLKTKGAGDLQSGPHSWEIISRWNLARWVSDLFQTPSWNTLLSESLYLFLLGEISIQTRQKVWRINC